METFRAHISDNAIRKRKSMRDRESILLRHCYEPNTGTEEEYKEGTRRDCLRTEIYRKLPQVLRDKGFKETEALEIFVD